MWVTLKATGFILIVCAFYIGGTLFEDSRKNGIKGLADVIKSVECMHNLVKCDKITVYEALNAISGQNSIMGCIAQKVLTEYESKNNVPLNQILSDVFYKYEKSGFVTPHVFSTIEYLFERLGKGDLEYQVYIFSETLDKLKCEYERLEGEYLKTKGLYFKSSLCIGVIVAVLFI